MSIFGKLIRDKVPDIIRANGGTPIVRTARMTEFYFLLYAKLHEEVDELENATTRPDTLNELVDVFEVVRCIAHGNGISMDELEVLRRNKVNVCGGFDERLVWLGNEESEGDG